MPCLPKAKEIASGQSFEGAGWMKMTDPSAQEAPSDVGSFLICKQPISSTGGVDLSEQSSQEYWINMDSW